MKQAIIITGGILSLTLMLVILVAIIFVSFFREESNTWENKRDVIQHSSIDINRDNLEPQEKSKALLAIYQRTNYKANISQLSEMRRSINLYR